MNLGKVEETLIDLQVAINFDPANLELKKELAKVEQIYNATREKFTRTNVYNNSSRNLENLNIKGFFNLLNLV